MVIQKICICPRPTCWEKSAKKSVTYYLNSLYWLRRAKFCTLLQRQMMFLASNILQFVSFFEKHETLPFFIHLKIQKFLRKNWIEIFVKKLFRLVLYSIMFTERIALMQRMLSWTLSTCNLLSVFLFPLFLILYWSSFLLLHYSHFYCWFTPSLIWLA